MEAQETKDQPMQSSKQYWEVFVKACAVHGIVTFPHNTFSALDGQKLQQIRQLWRDYCMALVQEWLLSNHPSEDSFVTVDSADASADPTVRLFDNEEDAAHAGMMFVLDFVGDLGCRLAWKVSDCRGQTRLTRKPAPHTDDPPENSSEGCELTFKARALLQLRNNGIVEDPDPFTAVIPILLESNRTESGPYQQTGVIVMDSLCFPHAWQLPVNRKPRNWRPQQCSGFSYFPRLHVLTNRHGFQYAKPSVVKVVFRTEDGARIDVAVNSLEIDLFPVSTTGAYVNMACFDLFPFLLRSTATAKFNYTAFDVTEHILPPPRQLTYTPGIVVGFNVGKTSETSLFDSHELSPWNVICSSAVCLFGDIYKPQGKILVVDGVEVDMLPVGLVSTESGGPVVAFIANKPVLMGVHICTPSALGPIGQCFALHVQRYLCDVDVRDRKALDAIPKSNVMIGNEHLFVNPARFFDDHKVPDNEVETWFIAARKAILGY